MAITGKIIPATEKMTNTLVEFLTIFCAQSTLDKTINGAAITTTIVQKNKKAKIRQLSQK